MRSGGGEFSPQKRWRSSLRRARWCSDDVDVEKGALEKAGYLVGFDLFDLLGPFCSGLCLLFMCLSSHPLLDNTPPLRLDCVLRILFPGRIV
jgi:hypothetical protein